MWQCARSKCFVRHSRNMRTLRRWEAQFVLAFEVSLHVQPAGRTHNNASAHGNVSESGWFAKHSVLDWARCVAVCQILHSVRFKEIVLQQSRILSVGRYLAAVGCLRFTQQQLDTLAPAPSQHLPVPFAAIQLPLPDRGRCSCAYCVVQGLHTTLSRASVL